ncbi:hypothetical protein [Domibacillus indicus]|uniref:Y-family DNA polymerase n=1 Tax=Domibacillus indicus TaxID=1437523 RepID=UPI0037C1708E
MVTVNQGTYVIVIAHKERSGSVVLAASPRVKKEFGIKTGSRNYEIPKDPSLIIVEPSMALYLKVNNDPGYFSALCSRRRSALLFHR